MEKEPINVAQTTEYRAHFRCTAEGQPFVAADEPLSELSVLHPPTAKQEIEVMGFSGEIDGHRNESSLRGYANSRCSPR